MTIIIVTDLSRVSTLRTEDYQIQYCCTPMDRKIFGERRASAAHVGRHDAITIFIASIRCVQAVEVGLGMISRQAEALSMPGLYTSNAATQYGSSIDCVDQ